VEFSGLPDSRIGSIESSIPPLQTLKTHESDSECSEALEYFLACISIRRLLNRSHHILYSEQCLDYKLRFPTFLSELQHQLYDWWNCLPQPLKFDLDSDKYGIYYSACVPQTDRQTYLRSRFLACQSVILRPYLMDYVYLVQKSSHLGTFDAADSALPATHGLIIKSSKACIVLALSSGPVLHTLTTSAWIMSSS
jgi:hypothetical protein